MSCHLLSVLYETPKYPVVYKTLENKEYVGKLEALYYIAGDATKHISFRSDREYERVFTFFLYAHSRRLSKTCEFLPKSELDNLLSMLHKIKESNRNRKLKEIKDERKDEIMQNTINFFAQAYGEADKTVEEILSKIQSAPEELLYTAKTGKNTACQVKQAIEILQELFYANKSFFFPELDEEPKPETKIVRLFTDGVKRYVMREELNFALYGIKIQSFLHQDDLRNWFTYTDDQAFEMTQKCGALVEFLITPINRPGNVAQSIRSPKGVTCKLAIDVFLDVSKHTLDRHDFCNIYRFGQPERFGPLFGELLDRFICYPETPVFFMNDRTSNRMKESLTAQLTEIDVNYVPDCFKAMVATAHGTLLEWINRNDRNRNVCLLKTIPEIATFIHTQQACHLFPTLTCCNEDNPEVKNLEEDYDKLTGLMEKIAQKIKEYKTKNPLTEKNVEGEVAQRIVPNDENCQERKPATEDVGLQTGEPRTAPECGIRKEDCEKLKTRLVQRLMEETDRSLKEFEELKRQLTEITEEKNQLEAKLEESDQFQEAMKSELAILLEENKLFKVTTTSLEDELTAVKEELSSYKPMSQKERNDVMRILEDRLETLYREDPIEKADQKRRNLNHWLECPVLLSEVQEDVAIFHEQITDFQQSLLRMMDTVNDNPNLTRRELPAIPTCPEQPERFRKLFEEENEKNNRQVEGECPLCFGLEEGKELFTCGACRFEIHLECLKNQVNCPACREPVKNPKRK